MGWVIVISVIVVFISFLILRSADNSATNGDLSPTSVKYLNGYLNYQSGVDVKIQADPNRILIDGKYHIPMQKISEIKIAKTKQLTEQQKNVIGRAVIGTILAGPVGGLVGGASGIGTIKKTEDVEILYITYKDEKELEQTMSFTLNNLAEKSFFLNSWVYGTMMRLHQKRNATV
jgi:hypothetical protein